MVARLKLKGIDGRAPPGVNHRQQPQRLCSIKPPERVRWCPPFVLVPVGAMHSNCGESLKPKLPSRLSKEVGGQVSSLGYGDNA